MYAFTPAALAHLRGYLAGSAPDTCLRLCGDRDNLVPLLDRKREHDTLTVIDGLPVVHGEPHPGSCTVIDYKSRNGVEVLVALPDLGKLDLTPAAKAAALDLLRGADDPQASLILRVAIGSGRITTLEGFMVGREGGPYQAWACCGLKVLVHRDALGMVYPCIVDWSERTALFTFEPVRRAG